jgi:hypothetical protein
MALKGSAKWVKGISRVRFMPLGGDVKMPQAKTAIGGTGPFDFTTAHDVIDAVPITIKVDNGAEVNDTIDLSGASVEAAVTATEFADAVTTAAITDLTASVDANGRVKLVFASGTVLQVYGQAAELGGFGQGLGQKFIKSDTLESVALNPDVKADDTKTCTTAEGIDIEVVTEGYKKGATGTVIDTAQDYELMRLFEGGIIDATTGAYEEPNELTVKPYFMIEIFNPVYAEGRQKYGDMTGYEKTLIKSAFGSVGNETFSADFRKKTYTFTATNYITVALVHEGAVSRTPLTAAEFAALDIDNV